MKLKHIFLAAGLALCATSAFAVNPEDVRIYINPGHGSWTSGDRHMGTVKHGLSANDAIDTTDFYESNTNLQKGLAMFHKLKSYGVKHEGVNALDLTQNIVMSHIECGPYPTVAMGGDPALEDAYNRNLSEISAEVEFNNFDVFVSIHSNAATEGTNTNYPLFLYRGTDAQEGNAGSVAMSKACWTHLYGLGHQQWTYYSMTNMNVRGDHDFYGSTSTVKYVISDPDYVYDETNGYSKFYKGQAQPVQKKDEEGNLVFAEVDTDGDGESDGSYPVYETDENGNLVYQTNADGSIFIAPDSVSYTGYLGVIKHGTPGFLAEGYFHTYQPARHRYMNWGVCHLEGEAYAKGLNDYFGWGKTEEKATIYGVLRDMHEKFSHQYYTPNISTNDKYLPLNNATVKLLDASGAVVATCATDDEYNGVFIFSNVEPGTYSLTYELEGYEAPIAEYTQQFTLNAGDMIYPEAFLENVDYVPPTKVYVNYPDSLADKGGYAVAPKYNVTASSIDLLAEQLAGKIVRRQIVRDDKLYVLALDAENEPFIYLADLAAGTVAELDKTPVVMGANGRLKISDIALTADHVLIASGLSKNQYSADYVEDGEERGSVNLYKWTQNAETGLPETCELWFSTDYACNFFRGLLGKTIAYSGTIEDGTLTVSCPHGTMTSAIGMRIAQFAIVEGQNTGAIRYDGWADEVIEVYFNADALSDKDDYEMMVSPLGDKNNFALDGNLIAPFEWTADGDGAAPVVLGRNEAINVKANGANYFRYAGRALMVAPKVNDEGKVEGIQLFDITDGFSNAKEIAVEGVAIEPVEYTYASAHGELDLEIQVIDSETQKTIGAELNLFLVIDGKVYKYTTADTDQPIFKAEYAYNLSMGEAQVSATGSAIHQLRFTLTGDAPSVNVILTEVTTGNEIVVECGAMAAGENAVDIDAAEIHNGSYTWAIEVNSNAVPSAACIFDAAKAGRTIKKNTRGGVAFVSDPESDAFGKIIVSNGYCQGFDYYTPELALEKTVPYAGNSGNAASAYRICENNGMIWATDWCDGYSGLYYFDATTPETINQWFEGTRDSDGAFTNNGVVTGGGTTGLDFYGEGENEQMFVFVEDYPSGNGQTLCRYDYAGATSWGQAPSATYPNASAKLGNTNIEITTTEYGFFASQVRTTGNNNSGYPGFIFVDYNDNVLYNSGSTGIVNGCSSGVAISNDGTQIAIATPDEGITMFALSWNEGVPAFEKLYTIPNSSSSGTYNEVNQLDFDVAGNLHAFLRTEGYRVYAVPNEAPKAVTPAKSAYVITGTSGVEDVEIVEENVAPVYYNLQGVQVANPENGIYIVKRGSKVTKEYIRK